MTPRFPHSDDIERALIAAAVSLGGQPLDAAVVADFYQPHHGALWALLLSMRDEGAPIDQVTVGERVLHARDPGVYGGPTYLFGCLDHAPPPLAWAYYARRVRDLAQRRKALGAALYVVDTLGEMPEHADTPLAVEAAARLVAGEAPVDVAILLLRGRSRDELVSIFRRLAPAADAPAKAAK